MEELAEELEEQRELATNTLQELEALNIKYRENLKKVEELQMNVSKHFRRLLARSIPGNSTEIVFPVKTFTRKRCR